VALLVLITSCALVIAFVSGGLLLSVIVGVGISGVLWITRGLWAPAEDGHSRVRMAIVGMVQAVALAVISGRPFLEDISSGLLLHVIGAENLGAVATVASPGQILSVLVFVGALLIGYAVNASLQDRSAMAVHPQPVDREFSHPDYHTSLRNFAELLRSHLRELDLRTNWSEAYFTPLEADVEVKTGRRARREVTDLLNAIRRNRRAKVFLVLGDPGSGKSVALRRLARILLDEVEKTGKVPVYINLKEWLKGRRWTEENPPTVADLHEFIRENLKARSDVFGVEFVDAYFDKMVHDGRFFFIFDSFDEIPEVLDVGESSWLVERLSTVFSTFFSGTAETRGVLSSRFFRRPTLSCEPVAVLEIRPFTEIKIVETLRHSRFFGDATVQHMFANRPDLVPAARNPFTAALIRSYLTNNAGVLPQTQLALYEDYIRRRLQLTRDRIRRSGMTVEEVTEAATFIAWEMFAVPEYGLEAPVEYLEKQLRGYRIREIVAVLEHARLARVGAGTDARFSFVHRRFNEYFVARRLIENPELIQPETIPLDSRWRETLVLYCQVAPGETATQIAQYCWLEVAKIKSGEYVLGDAGYLRAVHCLRFLTDAFRSRSEVLVGFRSELAEFILTQVRLEDNLLAAKLAVEATGLLSDQEVEQVILVALQRKNEWVSETAIRACRHLPRIGSALEEELVGYLDSIPPFNFHSRRRELEFSLSLSDGLSNVKRFVQLRSRDLISITALTVLLLAAFPFLGMVVGFFSLSALLFSPWSRTDDWARLTLRVGRLVMLAYMCLGVVVLVLDPLLRDVSTFPGLGSVISIARSAVSPYAFLPQPSPYGGKAEVLSFLTLLVILAVITPLYKQKPVWRGDFSFEALRGQVSVLMRPVRVVGLSILITVVLGVLSWLAQTYLDPFFGFDSALLILVPLLLVLVGFLMYILWANGSAWWRDRRRLRNAHRRPPTRREDIEEIFSELETSPARLRFVETLITLQVRPTGRWTKGLPTGRNDEASTLLAKLEEKWLDLDR